MPESAGKNQNEYANSNEAAPAGDPPEERPPWLSKLRREVHSIREEVRGLRKEATGLRKEVRSLREKDPDRLLDKSEVAEKLGCSERLVDTLVASGELPSVKVRRLRRIPKQALEAYIQQQSAESGGNAF